MKQGAYVQYPNGKGTEGYGADALALANKNLGRLNPLPLKGDYMGWFTNLMCWMPDSKINEGWVRTVVNPATEGSRVASLMFWWHLIVWVMAVVLTGIVNFGVSAGTFGQGGSGADDVDVSIADTSLKPSGAFPDGTKQVALYSGLCGVFGVVGILFTSAFYDLEAYKKSTGTNTTITFLLNYSLVGSFYIFAREASISDSSSLFVLALFGVIFHTYAVVLFYSCSAALDMLALPRAWIPTLAISVQLINYIEITNDNFKCRYSEMADPVACTDLQKMIAFLIPLLSGGAVLFMIFGRKLIRDPSMGGSQMKDAPLLRSIILTLFLTAGLLSVYKYAFMAGNNTDNVARMYAMFGLMLQFGIITVAFVPNPKPSANQNQISPDGNKMAAPLPYAPEETNSTVDIGV